MWFVFLFFLLSLAIGIHFYLPALVLLALFAGMLLSAGLALFPAGPLQE